MEFPHEDGAEGGPPEVGARFRMVRCLGSGGMGDVWLAEDVELHRPVAVKTVRAALAQNEEIRKRIERECLLHAKVGPHPHIVTLFDKIERDGHIYLIMELVEGETLQRLLERNGKGRAVLSVDEAVDIAVQCLEALSRIHAAGIVHRDIKPANIMLAREQPGDVCAKLMDFGIARFEDAQDALTRLTTAHGSSPGTPMYMAPEQIDSKTFGRVSYATDVYAVGILLYQMLSGEPPFTGTLTEVLNGHVNRSVPPIDLKAGRSIPGAFLDVLHRALAKRPEKRYSSAQAFREALVSPERSDAATTTRVILASKAQAGIEECETVLDSRSGGRDASVGREPERTTSGDVAVSGDGRAFGGNLAAKLAAGFAIVVVGLVVVFGLRGKSGDEGLPVVAPTETVGTVTSPVVPGVGANPVAGPQANGGAVSGEGVAGQEARRVDVSALPPPTMELMPIEPDAAGETGLGEETPASLPGTVDGVPDAGTVVPVDTASSGALPASGVPLADGVAASVAVVPAAGVASAVAAQTGTAAQGEVPGAAGGEANKTYVVQRGDSLSKIAAKFGIDVVDLARWNLLERPDQLKVGATLYLYKRANLPEIEVKFDSSKPKAAAGAVAPSKAGTPYRKTAEDLFVAPIGSEEGR